MHGWWDNCRMSKGMETDDQTDGFLVYTCVIYVVDIFNKYFDIKVGMLICVENYLRSYIAGKKI